MAGVAAETLVYNSAQGGADDRSAKSVLTPLGFFWLSSKAEGTLRLCKPTTCSKRIGLPKALVSAMQQRAELAECFRVIEQHRQNPNCGTLPV